MITPVPEPAVDRAASATLADGEIFSVIKKGVPPTMMAGWDGRIPDNDKVKENQPGAYYVDSSCIDCDVCRDTAPDSFRRSDVNSYSFVFKQPVFVAEYDFSSRSAQPPGAVHGPFKSENGCLLLEIHYYDPA